MLKMALLDCANNEKCCSVDGGRGIRPLFSSSPRGIWESPPPGICLPRQKNPNARGSARRGGGGWGLGAVGIDWCIWLMHNSTLDSHTNIVISHAFAYPTRWRRNRDKVYWESVHGCNLQCVNKSIIWVSSDNHSTISYSSQSWHEAVSDPIAKCCLNADMFLRVLEKRGKNLLLANAWKPW